jgi:hypothetical protein
MDTKYQEKGPCVSQHENWSFASPDGVFDGQTLLEVKCPVPTSNWTTLYQLYISCLHLANMM